MSWLKTILKNIFNTTKKEPKKQTKLEERLKFLLLQRVSINKDEADLLRPIHSISSKCCGTFVWKNTITHTIFCDRCLKPQNTTIQPAKENPIIESILLAKKQIELRTQ